LSFNAEQKASFKIKNFIYNVRVSVAKRRSPTISGRHHSISSSCAFCCQKKQASLVIQGNTAKKKGFLFSFLTSLKETPLQRLLGEDVDVVHLCVLCAGVVANATCSSNASSSNASGYRRRNQLERVAIAFRRSDQRTGADAQRRYIYPWWVVDTVAIPHTTIP
jgi:hypothetical protein